MIILFLISCGFHKQNIFFDAAVLYPLIFETRSALKSFVCAKRFNTLCNLDHLLEIEFVLEFHSVSSNACKQIQFTKIQHTYISAHDRKTFQGGQKHCKYSYHQLISIVCFTMECHVQCFVIFTKT